MDRIEHDGLVSIHCRMSMYQRESRVHPQLCVDLKSRDMVLSSNEVKEHQAQSHFRHYDEMVKMALNFTSKLHVRRRFSLNT